ncbi:MAG: hypothetical protein M3Q42_11335 [Pseudomonadota bacterium]|nr:hypothetical protein [Pseudomonadota bacterium]
MPVPIIVRAPLPAEHYGSGQAQSCIRGIHNARRTRLAWLQARNFDLAAILEAQQVAAVAPRIN